ncbi:MAG: hypothetical protein LBO73_04260 [Holosporaceae bacterium]|jgi:hypothetical protein|nr:hypothetical protein [Holosporaceae bacterium]
MNGSFKTILVLLSSSAFAADAGASTLSSSVNAQMLKQQLLMTAQKTIANIVPQLKTGMQKASAVVGAMLQTVQSKNNDRISMLKTYARQTETLYLATVKARTVISDAAAVSCLDMAGRELQAVKPYLATDESAKTNAQKIYQGLYRAREYISSVGGSIMLMPATAAVGTLVDEIGRFMKSNYGVDCTAPAPIYATQTNIGIAAANEEKVAVAAAVDAAAAVAASESQATVTTTTVSKIRR